MSNPSSVEPERKPWGIPPANPLGTQRILGDDDTRPLEWVLCISLVVFGVVMFWKWFTHEEGKMEDMTVQAQALAAEKTRAKSESLEHAVRNATSIYKLSVEQENPYAMEQAIESLPVEVLVEFLRRKTEHMLAEKRNFAIVGVDITKDGLQYTQVDVRSR